MVGYMPYVVIAGTNVGVGQMSGGTNVSPTNIGGTCVGETKVAPPLIVPRSDKFVPFYNLIKLLLLDFHIALEQEVFAIVQVT